MGMPASRITDMHVCPMVTGTGPPMPHVGGPILPPGAVTVLIGGLPAARVGDMAVCVRTSGRDRRSDRSPCLRWVCRRRASAI